MTDASLADPAWSRYEVVIRRFENAWRSGSGRPDVASFVPTDGSGPTKLIAELAHVDLEFRLRAGEPARAEDYLDRFPALRETGLVLDLIVAEYGLRARSGEPPQAAEYLRRFPEHRDELNRLLPEIGGAITRPYQGPAVPLGVPTVAGYGIDGELGRGGMGVVYRAWHPALARTVAIKTLAVMPKPETVARFRREAEAIARLDHPHIVPVYEVGEWDAGGRAVPYFVMKWYPGGSLDAAPCGPGSDPAAHARTVRAVAAAVHHAHGRGVLHRDLKPSNILLDDAGRPNVADFGLAGLVDADAQTVSVVGMGTPAYMAPEQAVPPGGDAPTVTAAADVYGLGAILYHQLTGRPPFRGPTALATLEMVAKAPPRRPSAINPDVPADLETVCLKCLEKDPAKRYPSAMAVAVELARFLAGEPIDARPVGPAGRAVRWVRRHRITVGLTAAAVFGLATAGAGAAVNRSRLAAEAARTAAAEERAAAANAELKAVRQREERERAAERVRTAGRLYADNRLDDARKELDGVSDHLRGWDWGYLDRLLKLVPAPVGTHPGNRPVTAVAFLADGRVASADAGGGVRVWPAGVRPGRSWAAGGRVTALAAHPGRPWLATAAADGVTIWEAETGEVIRQLGPGRAVAFAPYGNAVAVADGSAVRVFDAATGTARRGPAGLSDPVTAVAFSADGKRLLTTSADGTVRAWDAHTGDPTRTPAAADKTWAVARGVPNHAIRLNDPAGATVRTLRGQSAEPTALAVSGDGRRVASGDEKGAVRVWEQAAPVEYEGVAAVGPGPVEMAVRPDGQRVAVQGGALAERVPPDSRSESATRFDAEVVIHDTVYRRVIARVRGVGGLTFSPDGTRLAVGRAAGGVTVYDAETGFVRLAIDVPGATATRVAFSPDGRWLALADAAGTVHVRHADTGRPACTLAAGGAVTSVAFRPGTAELTAASPVGRTTWAIPAGQPLRTFPGGPTAVAYTPDGARLVTAGDRGGVRVEDVETGQTLHTIATEPPRSVRLAVSPDGHRAAVATAAGVRLIDLDAGRETLALLGADRPTAVAWADAGVFAVADQLLLWRGAATATGCQVPGPHR